MKVAAMKDLNNEDDWTPQLVEYILLIYLHFRFPLKYEKEQLI